MIVKPHTLKLVLMLLLMAVLPTVGVRAAVVEGDSLGFSVLSFRTLPNDVSAFIDPVRDLNGEACALVKVVAPADFAFSTPLGIVRREDKTGEIWLYLPKGTKTITIKHPQWGVLRDYRLGRKLESRMTYELRLGFPHEALEAVHDTVTLTRTVTDTVEVAVKAPPVKMAACLLLTAGFHTDGPSWGLMAMMLWRHGFFVHATTDFRATGHTVATSDWQGVILSDNYLPYYTGTTRHSIYTITAGAAHRLTNRLVLFEGMGYGRKATAWQRAESEGGGYVLNDGLTHKGVTGEAGLLFHFQRVSVEASVLTIAGKVWQGTIGVGVKLGKL